MNDCVDCKKIKVCEDDCKCKCNHSLCEALEDAPETEHVIVRQIVQSGTPCAPCHNCGGTDNPPQYERTDFWKSGGLPSGDGDYLIPKKI